MDTQTDHGRRADGPFLDFLLEPKRAASATCESASLRCAASPARSAPSFCANPPPSPVHLHTRSVCAVRLSQSVCVRLLGALALAGCTQQALTKLKMFSLMTSEPRIWGGRSRGGAGIPAERSQPKVGPRRRGGVLEHCAGSLRHSDANATKRDPGREAESDHGVLWSGLGGLSRRPGVREVGRIRTAEQLRLDSPCLSASQSSLSSASQLLRVS